MAIISTAAVVTVSTIQPGVNAPAPVSSSAPLNPDVWMTARLEKVPIPSAGTDVYRWSRKPLADAGAWKEARVRKFPPIRREAAHPSGGDYSVTTIDVDVEDKDGVIRALMSQKPTRYWTGREVSFELLSEAGRWAGLTPRPLFKGVIADIQTPVGRTARIKCTDSLGFHFTGFNLEKKFPQALMTRLEHVNLPDGNNKRPYPIVWGEHSDEGVVNAAGASAAKGMLPVFDTGDYVVNAVGDTLDDAQPIYLEIPLGLGAVVNGTPGTTEVQYVVTAISPYGETPASAVLVVSTGNATLSAVDSITLSWTMVANAVEYRVYKLVAGQFRLVQRLNNNETWVDPEETWTDTGSASTRNLFPPTVNTAQIDQVVDGLDAYAWGRLVASIGEMHSIHDVYASDLNEGGTPKRVLMSEDVYGNEFLVPGRLGWPHAENYIVINGIRMTVIYARGPRLKHHRDGVVTIAINGCGAFGPNGKVYDEAFPTLQWILNEHVLKNDGQGYRDGDYGPLVAYNNGVPIVKPSAYAAAQLKTIGYVGGRGYITAGAIHDVITIREFLHRYMVTFDFIMADDHHGQVYPFFIDVSNISTTAGRIYRDRIEIRRAVDLEWRHQDVETQATWDYDWDADAAAFRITDQDFALPEEAENHKEPKFKEKRLCYYSRHKMTVNDSNSRHVRRFCIPPRLFEFETDLTGLSDENGDQILVGHYELDDSGSLKPMVVMAHEVNPNQEPSKPMSVCLMGWDLSRYTAIAATADSPFPTVTVSAQSVGIVVGTAQIVATSASVGVSAPAATLIRGNPQVPASVVTVSAPDAGTVGGSLLSTSCAVTVTAPTALSLAPTVSNRTGWWKAATTVELWKEVAQTNHPANGEIVAAWDDVVDATAFRLGIKGGAGTEPLYVADGIKAGLGSVEFDGFNDYLHTIADASTTDAAMSNFFAAGAKSMYLAIWLTGNGSNDATVYNNNGIVIDVGTYFGLLAKTVTGVTALHAYNWDGNADSVSVAVSQGVLLIVSIRHNGTTLKLRVNGGTEVSVASGNTQNITNALEIGRSNNGSARYQAMRIGEMILYNTSHSDGDRDLNEAYLTGRWA